ncbi:MAG: LysE family translocator, partial [Motiliproteus sp.]|nr:LysE family translocator [Motiliproteus sp.]
MSFENWLLFCSIAFVATITPGPAILLVTSHSLSQGPLRAVATIMGNISGLFCMSLGSVLGLSTLILYSTTAFTVVKIVGALYLIYLGVRLWRQGFRFDGKARAEGRKTPLLGLYAQGLMVSLTNPKAIAFTTALFPQFIDTGAPLAG